MRKPHAQLDPGLRNCHLGTICLTPSALSAFPLKQAVPCGGKDGLLQCHADLLPVNPGQKAMPLTGVSNLLASLGHTGRRRVVLGHTLNTLQHIITKKSHNVLSKFTILCWAIFIIILSHMWPAGHRLDTPARSCKSTRIASD